MKYKCSIKASNISDNLITIREVKDKSKTLQIPITDRVREILGFKIL